MRNKIILVIIVLLAILALVIAFNPMDAKANTQINFLSDSNLQNGNEVQFVLKDVTGKPVAGQNVTISYDDHSGNIQNYSVVTDANGKGYLEINGENPGKYDITVSYNGNNKYNGCTATQSIVIKEGNSGTSQSSQNSPTNSTASTSMYNKPPALNPSSNTTSPAYGNLHYDSKYNFYYDDLGIIRGGQNDGYPADYIRHLYDEWQKNPSNNEE